MHSIYLSGASSELVLCESYRDKLVNDGWHIELDWMAKIRASGIGDTSLPVRGQQHVAQTDLWAVSRAECFWLVLPSAPSRTIGAWVELGYALALEDAPVIVISGQWNSIFDQLGEKRFVTHDEAFAYIHKLRCR